jgi:hypothetical protein
MEIDYTDIKIESVEDADDVLSRRPQYVEQADYARVFQEADMKSRSRVRHTLYFNIIGFS